MTLAEQALYGREFKTVLSPLTVYCYKCNVIIHEGELVQQYDGATFVHQTCPSTPHRTFAPHKYGDARG